VQLALGRPGKSQTKGNNMTPSKRRRLIRDNAVADDYANALSVVEMMRRKNTAPRRLKA